MTENRGPLLRVCASHRPPFISVVTENNVIKGLKGTTSGLLKLVVKALKKETRYVLVDPKTTLIGERNVSGRWSGLLGKLHRNECDICINPMTPTSHRSDAARFTQPFAYYSAGSVLSGPPTSLTYDLDALLNIFQKEVWIYLSAVLIVVPLVGYLLDKISSQTFIRNNLDLAVYYSRFWGSFLTQSQSLACMHTYSLVVITFWISMLFCLSSSYKGDVYSKITLPPKPEYIETITDVNKHPTLRVVTAKNNFEEDLIRDSEDPEVLKVWERILVTDGRLALVNMSSEETMAEVKKGSTAIVTSSVRAVDIAAKYCDPGVYLHASMGVMDIGLTLAVRKSFPKNLEEKMTLLFVHYFSSAHMEYHNRKSTVAADCLHIPFIQTSPDEPIELTQIQASFQVGAVGLLLAILVFIFEVLYFRFVRQRILRKTVSCTRLHPWTVESQNNRSRERRQKRNSNWNNEHYKRKDFSRSENLLLYNIVSQNR